MQRKGNRNNLNNIRKSNDYVWQKAPKKLTECGLQKSVINTT